MQNITPDADFLHGGNMDPVSGLTLFGSIAGAAKNIAEIAKAATNHEVKVQLNEVYDTLTELKQAAANLEDENRELRRKLEFQSDKYEFRNPYHYEKGGTDQPLCPKCFAKGTVGRMSELGEAMGLHRRHCLVCDNCIYGQT
jgi:hypothetical protein